MQTSKRIIGVTALLGLAATLLTACDPPMPPDVAAQIAEQTYTCVQGSVALSSPANLSDPVSQWQSSVSQACVSPLPEMALTSATGKPDLVIAKSSPSSSECTAFASSPLAVEAADVVFNLGVTTTLVLSPKNISDIFAGKITNWNDPKLAKENNGTTLPDEPILINHDSDAVAVKSLNAWFTRLSAPLNLTSIKQAAKTETSYYSDLQEGEIAIAPGSAVNELGSSAVSVLVSGANSKSPVVATPDAQGVSSAATQWKASVSGDVVSVKLDPAQAPVAPVGFDKAAVPYQAISPVNLYLCGDDTKVKRAAAFFLLRLDSQGVLGASNYNQLSEPVREVALLSVRKGLPTPKASKVAK